MLPLAETAELEAAELETAELEAAELEAGSGGRGGSISVHRSISWRAVCCLACRASALDCSYSCR
jgi:hypothetical protein